MYKLAIFLTTFVFASSVMADNDALSVKQARQDRLQYVTSLQQLSDAQKLAILSGKTELNEYEKFLAEDFKLSEDDMKKYKKIMLGKRGVWTPGLDPITALGVAETNAQERLRYAKLWLEVEGERVDLQFKFERAVASMREEVFGNQQPFDSTQKIAAWKEERSRPVANIDVLVRSNCQIECKEKISELVQSRGRGRLNFFFIDNADDADIIKWAEYHTLDAQLVKAGVITLNYGKAKMQTLDVTEDEVKTTHVIVNFIDYSDD